MFTITQVTVNWDDEATSLQIYFWPINEKVLDNLQNRRNRPHEEYQKLIPEVLTRAAAEIGVSQDELLAAAPKAEWSLYTGCKSCPCSPGFSLPIRVKLAVHVRYDGPKNADQVLNDHDRLCMDMRH